MRLADGYFPLKCVFFYRRFNLKLSLKASHAVAEQPSLYIQDLPLRSLLA
jgi:hypothetical protein